MDIEKLRSFFMVADTGSFSVAAERLYISQSTASKHVRKLEDELGVQLLMRSGKSFVLTPAGRKLLRYYSEILEIYDKSQDALEKLRKEDENLYELKIVGGNRMSHYGIIHSLTAFMHIYPEVKLNIDDTESKNVLFALQSRDYELAFCQNTTLDAAVFSWQHYLLDSFVVVVNVASEFANKKVVFLSELKQKPLIVGVRERIRCQQFSEKENYNFDYILETDDPATAIEILISNADCAYIVPKTVMLKYTGELTKQIPLKGLGECLYVLAWKKGGKLSETAKNYLKFMQENSAEDFVKKTLERKFTYHD